jgi:hypothetical protein
MSPDGAELTDQDAFIVAHGPGAGHHPFRVTRDHCSMAQLCGATKGRGYQ